MENLKGDPEWIVKSANSMVWKIERKFAEKRFRDRLSLGNETLYKQISLNGLKATALGMAGAYWAAIGFVVFVAGVLVKQSMNSNGNVLKWSVLIVAGLIFLIAVIRTLQSIMNQISYRSREKK